MDEVGLVALMDELCEMQRKKLLRLGRERIPTLTPEDLLQPNDYSELEECPLFRYEEGIVEGLLSSRMALLAYLRRVSQ